VRKLRVPLQGMGKSGGARLIYYYRGAVGRIYLITAYSKSRKETLSREEQRAIQMLVRTLDREP